jgi:DNA polymerase-3 subunit delta
MAKSNKKAYSYNDLEKIKKMIFEKPLYICGKDNYIAEQIIKELCTKVMNMTLKEFNIKTIDGKKAKPEDIINEINTLPVLDKYKLVTIKNSTLFEKNNKSDNKQIQGLIQAIQEKYENLLLVFLSDEMPYWTNTLYEYFKQMDAAFELNGCDEQNRYIKNWLCNEAKSLDINLNEKCAEFMLTYVGYFDEGCEVNARMLIMELNKLASYCAGKNEIEPEDIKKICTAYLADSIDVFIGELNNKDLLKAIATYEQLTKNNIYPTVILTAITSNFNMMLLYKQYSKETKLNAWGMLTKVKNLKSIKYARLAGIQNIIEHHLRFNERKIKSILFVCARYDNAVKSGTVEAKIGLERIIYFICS